jgi:dimethylamine/trimethylamine dehydrogenase
MMDLDVEVITARALTRFDGSHATLECVHGGEPVQRAVESVVNVTLREPDDALFLELQQRLESAPGYRPASLRRIGDCDAPAIIAAAVYSGHRYARELEADVDADNPARYDRVFFDDD